MTKEVKAVDINGKEYIVPVDQLEFRPSVYGVVIKDNKILLSKQFDGYDIPGGGVQLGEKLHEAVMREVKEETGFDVYPKELLGCESSFFKLPSSSKFIQSILMYYSCDVTGGEISAEFLDEWEKGNGDRPEWVELDKALGLKFVNSEYTPKMIKKAINGRGLCVHHVAISVSDKEKSADFYIDNFGFKEINRYTKPGWDGSVIVLQLNYIRLEIFGFEKPIPKKDDLFNFHVIGLKHIAFQVDDAWEKYRELKDNSVNIDEPKQGTTCRWFCFLQDPDGIPIELYEANK